jgi:hypothetical protein
MNTIVLIYEKCNFKKYLTFFSSNVKFQISKLKFPICIYQIFFVSLPIKVSFMAKGIEIPPQLICRQPTFIFPNGSLVIYLYINNLIK